jgi:hypothetical protein
MSTITMPAGAEELELPLATFEPLVASGLADGPRSEAEDDEDDEDGDLFGDDDDAAELDEDDAEDDDDDDLDDEDLGSELDD